MLKNNRPDSEWTDFTSEDYCLIHVDGKPYRIMFKCPGCERMICVQAPPWRINFELLTARESILHTAPDGCGWHGYLTRGTFTLDCPPTTDV